MTGRQLNIRLDPTDSDRLEALAFVRRVPPSVLAREVLVEYVGAHLEEPGVSSAMAARAERDLAERAQVGMNVARLVRRAERGVAKM